MICRSSTPWTLAEFALSQRVHHLVHAPWQLLGEFFGLNHCCHHVTRGCASSKVRRVSSPALRSMAGLGLKVGVQDAGHLVEVEQGLASMVSSLGARGPA
jgi:hypothetical protein